MLMRVIGGPKRRNAMKLAARNESPLSESSGITRVVFLFSGGYTWPDKWPDIASSLHARIAGKRLCIAPPELSPEEQIKAMSIEELGLSVRSYKGLKHLGVETVGELIRVRPAELVRLKNFGKISLDEIRKVLQTMNLSLNEPPAQ